MEVINRIVTIKSNIDDAPKESDFTIKNSPLLLQIEPGSNDIILKNLYVSIDPYQIHRFKTHSSSQGSISFASAILPGEEVDAYGVGKVVVSGNPEFESGDLVVGLVSWGDYTVVKPRRLIRKFDPMGFPFSYQVGVLGISGLTAYAGFHKICKPKKGEKVLVSAASGSVGNLVGQYAKLFGCYVVGSAGSREKVSLLKEKLGFDDAFNYKEEIDLKTTLKRYFPNGIDIYFDNVGGEMLEASVANMNLFGRVAACGAIAEYVGDAKRAAPDMLDIVYRRIQIHGFLAGDHMNVLEDFLSTTRDHLQAERMQPLDDVSDGLESIPSAFLGLFRGDNIGKKIVRIAEE